MKTTKMLLQEIEQTQSEILQNQMFFRDIKERIYNIEINKSTAIILPIIGFVGGVILSFIPMRKMRKIFKVAKNSPIGGQIMSVAHVALLSALNSRSN